MSIWKGRFNPFLTSIPKSGLNMYSMLPPQSIYFGEPRSGPKWEMKKSVIISHNEEEQ